MGRRRRSTVGSRLAAGFVLVVLAGLFHLGDRPRIVWFIVLTLIVPYVIFVLPLPCHETTRRGQICSGTRWGWLIGCGNHRWYRMGRIFRWRGHPLPGGQPVAVHSEPGLSRARRPVPVQVVSEAPVGAARRIYDGAMLVIAVVSAIAGVVQVTQS